jgi:hypothetical protein
MPQTLSCLRGTSSIALAIVLVLLAVAGCTPGSSQPTPTPFVVSRGVAQDKASLLNELQKAGIQVKSTGKVEQPFLSIPGESFEVNAEWMQVFEYPDENAAGRDATKISPDGEITGFSIGWIAQPHFYRSGRILAIFLGSDPALLAAMESAAGTPIGTGPYIPGPNAPIPGTPTP